MNRLIVLPLAVSMMLAFGAGIPSLAADSHCQMNCHQCEASCDSNAKRLEKQKGDASLIKRLQDCAQACKDYAGGKGKNRAECQALCVSCAEACEKTGDAALQACATECRKCADSCSK
jgi:hypothetical protein